MAECLSEAVDGGQCVRPSSAVDICFSRSATTPFLHLKCLALPVGVSASGRLANSLTTLRHLPILESLFIRLRVLHSNNAAEERRQQARAEEESSERVT